MEEKGFDANLTAGEIYRILRGGWEMLPATYEMPILDMWCGFRPGSRDNLPLLGESSVKGLFMATGHYRHGFLLTPATAGTPAAAHLGSAFTCCAGTLLATPLRRAPVAACRSRVIMTKVIGRR